MKKVKETITRLFFTQCLIFITLCVICISCDGTYERCKLEENIEFKYDYDDYTYKYKIVVSKNNVQKTIYFSSSKAYKYKTFFRGDSVLLSEHNIKLLK